jgi:hypothetical protein
MSESCDGGKSLHLRDVKHKFRLLSRLVRTRTYARNQRALGENFIHRGIVGESNFSPKIVIQGLIPPGLCKHSQD